MFLAEAQASHLLVAGFRSANSLSCWRPSVTWDYPCFPAGGTLQICMLTSCKDRCYSPCLYSSPFTSSYMPPKILSRPEHSKWVNFKSLEKTLILVVWGWGFWSEVECSWLCLPHFHWASKTLSQTGNPAHKNMCSDHRHSLFAFLGHLAPTVPYRKCCRILKVWLQHASTLFSFHKRTTHKCLHVELWAISASLSSMSIPCACYLCVGSNHCSHGAMGIRAYFNWVQLSVRRIKK